MFCGKCGEQLNEGAAFCGKCGTPVETAMSREQTTVKKQDAGKLNKGIIIGTGAALVAVFLIVVISVSGRLFEKDADGTIEVVNDDKGDNDDIEVEEEITEVTYKYFNDEIKPYDVVTFGYYEQDGDLTNGKEPITWIVLNEENHRYLLLSQYVLDCHPWDDGSAKASGALAYEADVEYEKSSVRKWLNDVFAAEAFGEEELSYILPVSFRGEEITANENNAFATDYAFLMDYDYAVGISGGSYYKTDINRSGYKDYTYYIIGTWFISAPTEYAIQQGVPVYSYETCANKFASLQIENWDLTASSLNQTTYSMDYAPWFIRQIGDYSPWYLRTLWKRDKSYDNAVIQVSEIGQYQPTEPHQSLGIRPAIYVTIPTEQRASWELDESVVQEAIEHFALYNGTYDTNYYREAVSLTISDDGIELTGPRASYIYDREGMFYITDKEPLYGQLRLDYFEYYVDENGYDCFYDKKDGVKLVFNNDEGVLSYWVDYLEASFDYKEYDLLRGQPLGWVELIQYKKRQE